MKDEDFEYLICSAPDREKVFCELYYRGEIIADISQETEEPLLTIFASPSASWWEVPLPRFQKILEDARRHLMDSGTPQV